MSLTALGFFVTAIGIGAIPLTTREGGMVDYLRFAQLALCAAVFALTTVSAIHQLLLGSHRPGDSGRVATWFTALVLGGFCIRWLVFPHPEIRQSLAESNVWCILYLLGIGAIVNLFAATWRVGN